MHSLYLHIPFCEKKCFYCSFAVSIGQEKRIERYLECVAKEARQYRHIRMRSVYMGGGTPTFLNISQLKKLLQFIHNSFYIEKDAEWTIEANPEGLDLEKLRLLRESGINRISLGVQSLQNNYLKYLGRCHSRQAAVTAFENMRKAGFDNISLDLMYSFPNQTNEEIEQDVREIASLGSEHLSLYALTIEPNSRFFIQNVNLADNHTGARQYLLVLELLERYGFKQYEVSNFAKPGFESRHNMNYWTGGNYIGLGMGAHSHMDGRRFWNTPKLTSYITQINKSGSAVEGEERLDAQERLMETVLFGLRMNQGVDIDSLTKRFRRSFSQDKQVQIDHFIKEGLLVEKDGQFTTSAKGRLVLDDICARLL